MEPHVAGEPVSGGVKAHAAGGPPIPAVVLGGSGYVAGELLRLLAGHPSIRPAAVFSESQAGEPIEAAFPHLAGCYGGLAFSGRGELPRVFADIAGEMADGVAEAPTAAVSSASRLPTAATSLASRLSTAAVSSASRPPTAATSSASRLSTVAAFSAEWLPPEAAFSAARCPPEAASTAARLPIVAAFSAAPHGASAPLVGELMAAAEAAGVALRVVDLSADFRFSSADDYARVYGKPHGAPDRLGAFRCALPEHDADAPGACVGHPGCFTTATLLAAVPLLALGLVEPRLSVVAVTGSTGAGRAPSATTHHPARRSNLFAYSPLAHRHEPEMRALAEAASGVAAEIHFVPQAGPFARGIYATVQARLVQPLAAAGVRQALAGFYAGAPFVHVAGAPPRLQDVVGSNRCHLAVAADGDHLAVFSAIDNLVKGAAGGGIQWMNRLLGLPETAGLTSAGLGWL